MKETSMEAYRSLENIENKRARVYEAIKKLGMACNLDLAYELHWPINRITPRTNELVKDGFVIEAKRDITPRTGRRVIFWKIKQGVFA